MKPQDIIILIKLNIWQQGRWRLVPLAESLFLSKSEVHLGIGRLKQAGLYDEIREAPKKSAMQEFIIHGLRYTFPAELGAPTRGIVTGITSDFMTNHIVASKDEIYVWPSAEGKAKGFALSPLYKNVPEAITADRRLYHYLALIDVLRIGRAREQTIAKEELVKLIKLGNQYEIESS